MIAANEDSTAIELGMVPTNELYWSDIPLNEDSNPTEDGIVP